MKELIVNTAAVQGRRRVHLEDLARRALPDVRIAPTEQAGDVARLAEDACRRGVQRLVVAGGDGTVHEAANGIEGFAVELSIIPGGSGNDYVRSLGIPHDFVRALECAAGGQVRVLDAADVTCQGFDGHSIKRVFVNIAEVGLGGEVVRRSTRLRRFVGRRAGYHAGLALCVLSMKLAPVRLVIDGQDVGTYATNNLIVANGQYFGGGMHPVPDAVLDDGLLDVVLIHDMSKLALARQSHLVHTGLPRGHEHIEHWRGRRIEVSSPSSVLVEADGELLGLLPAVFEIRPGALRVVAPGVGRM